MIHKHKDTATHALNADMDFCVSVSLSIQNFLLLHLTGIIAMDYMEVNQSFCRIKC